MSTKTGEDVLREAMRNRLRSPARMAQLTRDLSISAVALEAWATGTAKLPPQMLDGICREVFGGFTELDHATGLLRSANKEEPKSIGTAMAFDPKAHVNYHGTSGPNKPMNPVKPQPKMPLPGWATD